MSIYFSYNIIKQTIVNKKTKFLNLVDYITQIMDLTG